MADAPLCTALQTLVYHPRAVGLCDWYCYRPGSHDPGRRSAGSEYLLDRRLLREKVKEILGVPQEIRVVALLPLVYPAEEAKSQGPQETE